MAAATGARARWSDLTFAECRGAADPPRHPRDGKPGGSLRFTYTRLHGAPRIYYSSYSEPRLQTIAAQLGSCRTDAWCIFDNTALGHATHDALAVASELAHIGSAP